LVQPKTILSAECGLYAPPQDALISTEDSLLQATPVYRSYSPNLKDHFYTSSSAEAEAAQTILGYNPEGIGLYATNENSFGFDGFEYLAGYGDLIQGLGADTQAAEIHYLQFGVGEGRSYDNFDNEAYLAANLDVAADAYFGQNSAEHYVRFGFAEGRSLV
jgi:hypothetical protein